MLLHLPRLIHPAAALALIATATLAAPAITFTDFTYAGHDTTTAPLPANHYRNPILPGFYPDPSICRAGEDYYLVNSTFGYHPGLPVFHSRDLVNWTQIANAIDHPSQLDYAKIDRINQGLYAPAITHHDGTYYIVCTMIGAGGNFVITAANPAGPWSDPVWLDFPGIDPSLFFDDDGRVWLVHNGDAPDNKPLYDGHRAIWLREFDPVAKKITGSPRLIINGGVNLAEKPVWIEGPHLFKRDGWYYLCCAEGGTSTNHRQVIFRSRAVTGPFEPWSGNPILTQRDLDSTAPDAVTSTGHADLVTTPDGQWWAVFLACRPFAEGKHHLTGRETFLLPVTWTPDGWPVILPPGQRVPLMAPAPGNAEPQLGPTAQSAALSWLTLRTPPNATTDYTIDTAHNRITLTPSTATLSGKQHPAFLARRIQHANFTATTTLDLSTLAPGTTAGIALFQSETNHYYLAATRDHITIELTNNTPAPTIIHTAPLPARATRLRLRIQATNTKLQLAWTPASTDTNDTADTGAWTTFDAPDGTLPVTTEAAGGGLHFTGAVIGPHARIERTSTLREAYRDAFLIGAALNRAHIGGKDTALITTHFNSITPENVMKWNNIHPAEGRYDFAPADRLVEFGQRNNLAVIGHTLIWHQHPPPWVFQNADGTPVTRDTLLARMRDHIHTVVGRYKNRVKGWDVVNEALNDDGTERDSPWRKIIGDDYIAHAFRYAHEADPAAELYYNDFSIENPAKRAGAIALLKKLIDSGAPVAGVGIQEHVNLTWPKLADLDDTIAAFAALNLKVMITELDITVLPSRNGGDDEGAEITRTEKADPSLNPYPGGLPPDMQQKLARRYADLFAIYLKHRAAITRVTFWGVTDADTWLNNWPIRGRTNYPLLFDRSGHPKPAFDAVVAQTAKSASVSEK